MLTHAEVRATMDTLPDVPKQPVKVCEHPSPTVRELGGDMQAWECACGVKWRTVRGREG